MGSRWVVLALALAVATGCVSSNSVTCSDGHLCPADNVCLADGCATPEDVAACSGQPDGAACTAQSGGAGTCQGGACRTGLCGNGAIDVGEVCDGQAGIDVAKGETCSGDCQTIWSCGNGIVDPNEQCDDANDNPADGCDHCVATEWVPTAVLGQSQLATQVGLFYPVGLAVDRAGNIYIADSANARLLRVDIATGTTTTIAGTGTGGYNGDGDLAGLAMVASPFGIAVDGQNNVYVADTYNYRIRRIDGTTGIITTVAGSGVQGFSGDGGPAVGARLFWPFAIALDGNGTLYIADTYNQRIRKVDPITGIITTVAGNGTQGSLGDGAAATAAELSQPNSVAIDPAGNLFITEGSGHRIRKVNLAGVITTVAGTGVPGFSGDNGPATAAKLQAPRSLRFDSAGNLFVADQQNYRVRRIAAGTGVITTVAGNGTRGYSGDGGPATSAMVDPYQVTVDPTGAILVLDYEANRVRRVDASGTITTVVGAGTAQDVGDGGAATSALLDAGLGMAVDSTGNMFFCDTGHERVRRVDAVTGTITAVAGNGVVGFGGDGGLATDAQLNSPNGVAVDSLGNLFIADSANHRVRRVDHATGVITTIAGTGVSGFSGDNGPGTSAMMLYPHGPAVDAAGNVFIADTGNHRIRRIDATTGVITTVAGTGVPAFSGDNGAATVAQLSNPYDVAFDASGNMLIVDSGNQRIRRVSAAGVITTVAGNGTPGYTGDNGSATSAEIQDPQGVAVDASGTIYIADGTNVVVRKVTGGVITTFAGDGSQGLSGDAGPAIAAEFGSPNAVAIDPAGNLLISDNAQIRRVITSGAASGIITTIAGAVEPDGMGPVTKAHMAEPVAMIATPGLSLIAGGSTGTLQALRASSLEVVAGRYPFAVTTNLALYRPATFGNIDGVAYDVAAGHIFLTESTANLVHAVTIMDPADARTWTIATLAGTGAAGFADGAAATAKFREPKGMFFDDATHVLYVADVGNHVIRAIDLSGGLSAATVSTVVGTPQVLGFDGDGAAASLALLDRPTAITRCTNGDMFVADTGNNRIRRVEAGTNVITTVIGDGTPASSGDGTPAKNFTVDNPRAVACDPFGNLFVTSHLTVREVAANNMHVVDGSGPVLTVYGAAPRNTPPASTTRCLMGLVVIDDHTIRATDACTGTLVEARRQPKP